VTSLKAAWITYDKGDPLSNEVLNSLISDVKQGIEFLKNRGETGGALFKARFDRGALLGFKTARREDYTLTRQVDLDTQLKKFDQQILVADAELLRVTQQMNAQLRALRAARQGTQDLLISLDESQP